MKEETGCEKTGIEPEDFVSSNVGLISIAKCARLTTSVAFPNGEPKYSSIRLSSPSSPVALHGALEQQFALARIAGE